MKFWRSTYSLHNSRVYRLYKIVTLFYSVCYLSRSLFFLKMDFSPPNHIANIFIYLLQNLNWIDLAKSISTSNLKLQVKKMLVLHSLYNIIQGQILHVMSHNLYAICNRTFGRRQITTAIKGWEQIQGLDDKQSLRGQEYHKLRNQNCQFSIFSFEHKNTLCVRT